MNTNDHETIVKLKKWKVWHKLKKLKMSLGFFQRGLKQKIPVVYPLILAGKVLLLPEWEQNNPY
jgi:hypothetical protein